MDELLAELKRIADALEAQNRIYVERCAESDRHDLEIVEQQHAARTAELKLEYRNLKLVQQLYAEQRGNVEDAKQTTHSQT